MLLTPALSSGKGQVVEIISSAFLIIPWHPRLLLFPSR
jgi:hypothetical protein